MTSDTRAFRNFEHEGWQRAASQYDSGFGPLTTQAVPALLDAAGVAAEMHVLAVACGPGYVAAAAAARGAIVTAVDFSSEMVGIARAAYPGLDVREGDAENLDFPAGSFDAVVMNFGMVHLGRPEQAVQEAWRVLRPGGRYAFTVWAAPNQAIGFNLVLQAVQAHGDMNVGLPDGPPFFRFSDFDEATALLQRAGFTDIHIRQVPQFWSIPSGDVVLETMRRAAVRTAALLNRQSAPVLERIAGEVRLRAEVYRAGGSIVLPMPAVVASGLKAA